MSNLDQIPLFDESQLPSGWELLLPAEEQRHRFTGERVALNQARHQAIIQALGEGLGIRQICRAFSVSQHTVEGIRERDASLVATEKERTGRQLRRIVRMTLGRLEEALENDEITPGQLPVTAGILIDKSLNWDGQPTHTIAVRHELDQAKVLEMFRQMQQPVIEAELVSMGGTPDSQSTDIATTSQQIAGREQTCGHDVVDCTRRLADGTAARPS
jgi:hypothetical protein